ncbi:hypothetical protein V8G54_018952 [Vigna mungo]|uniref:Mitochondrial import inner membrane translocase subunit TIM50 n=1 Tax=Vigna mungo TaxID=3915 RepID=A0AAQ3NA24_VIGMU
MSGNIGGKNKVIEPEGEHEKQDSATDLKLSLEKLNLGPRKKLLVMNLNGLLMHRVHIRDIWKVSKSRSRDGVYGSFLVNNLNMIIIVVFKRPFCEEFMKFCLERFEVGIWSSAKEYNMDAALAIAIGSIRKKISFKLDQSHCTDSGYKSLEKATKPLFFKEFNKMWEKAKKSGPFNVSNTLLIDDKPYKAFLNPDNTAIFPESYDVNDVTDRGLDPRGELCSYLEAVADAPDVPSYVKDHPFGQLPITSAHPHWKFYSEVKQSRLKKRASKIPRGGEHCGVILKGSVEGLRRADLRGVNGEHRKSQPLEVRDRLESRVDGEEESNQVWEAKLFLSV